MGLQIAQIKDSLKLITKEVQSQGEMIAQVLEEHELMKNILIKIADSTDIKEDSKKEMKK